MKIIIDVMGGDNAPEAGVIGVLDAAAAMPEHSYIIVGRENEIRDTARAAGREKMCIRDSVKMNHSHHRHNLGIKAQKRKRHLRSGAYLSPAFAATVKSLMPSK